MVDIKGWGIEGVAASQCAVRSVLGNTSNNDRADHYIPAVPDRALDRYAQQHHPSPHPASDACAGAGCDRRRG